jgi:hypothetical protein
MVRGKSPRARSAPRRFANRWAADYSHAVACRRDNLDELLACWYYKSLNERKPNLGGPHPLLYQGVSTPLSC